MRRIAALLILSVAGIASSVHAQTISWSQVFNGPSEPPVGATLGSTEDPRAIAVDAAGNIFAGGVTQSFENATGGVKLKFVPHDDFVVITYDGAGQQLWGSVFDFPTLGDDQSSPATRSGVDSMAAMIATPEGGVVAVGRATTRYSEDGFFGFTQAGVVKFNADGEVAWNQLLGDGAVSTVATAVVGDGGFGMYVGGGTALATNEQDSFVTYLDGAGVPVWTAAAGYPFSQVIQVVRDPAGACVALAGISGGGCKLVRVGAGGVSTTQEIPALAGGATGVGVALASDGCAIVAGSLGGDLILAKVHPSGSQVWSTTWRPSDGRTVVSRAVSVDAAGVIRVAGHVGSIAGLPADLFVATFDSTSGASKSFRAKDTGLNRAESSARGGVTIEPSGRTLVAGFVSTGVAGDNDYAIGVFDATDASRDWSARWSNPTNPQVDDRAAAIMALPNGNIAVVGRSDGGASSVDIATIVLTPPATVACDGIDFNNNTVFPEDADVIDFFEVLAGGECSTGLCNDIDFNNNTVFPEDADVIDFFEVLAGGEC
ncbi:hypothetical protein LBMAG48_21360 [Phycisphaerae bacterium]|nr:hypothetical protein LBMAG48_21360 [Phycisphaerae bacterium]